MPTHLAFDKNLSVDKVADNDERIGNSSSPEKHPGEPLIPLEQVHAMIEKNLIIA